MDSHNYSADTFNVIQLLLIVIHFSLFKFSKKITIVHLIVYNIHFKIKKS